LLAQEGADVAIFDSLDQLARVTADAIARDGRDYRYLHCDVRR
jgi:NAD(P)-dependent dehydrogenase (short-subunit alcohol dehydrogenase family)